MTIQNMFNLAKGQTLTQDGCEADVDDKRYNIGDISQKTGLQKTANGWVKPKNGKAPGAKTGPGESPKNVYGAEVDKIYERQLKRIKELRAKGFTDEQIDNDKIIKQTKEDMKNVNKIDTTAAQKKLDKLTKNKASFEERNKVAEQIKAANEYNYLVENLEKRGDKPTAEMQKKLTELKAKAESKPGAKKGNAERQEKIEKLRERAFNKKQLEGLSKRELDNLYESEIGSKPAKKESDDEKDRREAHEATVSNTIKDILLKRKVNEYFSESSPTGSKALLREKYHLNDWEADDVYEQLRTASNMQAANEEAEERDRTERREARRANDCAPRVLTKDTKIRVRKA